MKGGTITFTANGKAYSVPAPDSEVIFDSTVKTATTSYDSVHNVWVTTAPPTSSSWSSGWSNGWAGSSSNVFLSGVKYQATDNWSGIQNITWQGSFSSDTPGVKIQWQWSESTYSQMDPDYNKIGVKPVDDNQSSQYQNWDHAGTPENCGKYQTHNNGDGSSWGGDDDNSHSNGGNSCTPGQPSGKGGDDDSWGAGWSTGWGNGGNGWDNDGSGWGDIKLGSPKVVMPGGGGSL